MIIIIIIIITVAHDDGYPKEASTVLTRSRGFVALAEGRKIKHTTNA